MDKMTSEMTTRWGGFGGIFGRVQTLPVTMTSVLLIYTGTNYRKLFGKSMLLDFTDLESHVGNCAILKRIQLTAALVDAGWLSL